MTRATTGYARVIEGNAPPEPLPRRTGYRMSVVTVEQFGERVVLAAWPGKEHITAARTLAALGRPASGKVTIRRYEFQANADGVQHYVEPVEVKKYV